MKKAIGLTNADISEATGNTTNSIKTITQPSRMADNCPGWLKFAIIVFELMQKKDNNNIHNNQPSGAKQKTMNKNDELVQVSAIATLTVDVDCPHCGEDMDVRHDISEADAWPKYGLSIKKCEVEILCTKCGQEFLVTKVDY